MRFYATTWDQLHLELERAFDALATADEPGPVFHCTTANLPDPAKYNGRFLYDTTAGALKYSDGSSWS